MKRIMVLRLECNRAITRFEQHRIPTAALQPAFGARPRALRERFRAAARARGRRHVVGEVVACDGLGGEAASLAVEIFGGDQR